MVPCEIIEYDDELQYGMIVVAQSILTILNVTYEFLIQS